MLLKVIAPCLISLVGIPCSNIEANTRFLIGLSKAAFGPQKDEFRSCSDESWRNSMKIDLLSPIILQPWQCCQLAGNTTDSEKG